MIQLNSGREITISSYENLKDQYRDILADIAHTEGIPPHCISMISHKPRPSNERKDIQLFSRPEMELDDYGMQPISRIVDIDPVNPVLYYSYFDYHKDNKQ